VVQRRDRRLAGQTALAHPASALGGERRGWITTDPRTLKARHLARVPYVSLAYGAEPEKPVYADCLAQWIDDPDEKRRIWDLVAATPPPLGFDPAPI
jgi:hypothetical protein